eukprot:404861-Amphidinium_carterae.1
MVVEGDRPRGLGNILFQGQANSTRFWSRPPMIMNVDSSSMILFQNENSMVLGESDESPHHVVRLVSQSQTRHGKRRRLRLKLLFLLLLWKSVLQARRTFPALRLAYGSASAKDLSAASSS